MTKVEDVKAFLNRINYSPEQQNMVNKHMVSLSVALDINGLSGLFAIIDYFIQKQIIKDDSEHLLLLPSQFTVLCHPLEEIKARVAQYEAMGAIELLRKNITRINIKSSIPTVNQTIGNKPADIELEQSPLKIVENPIAEILNSPQSIGLNDETFARYEKLAGVIQNIMVKVYGINEVNDSIIDNLIKLITNEIADDRTTIFYAITFGKTLSAEEEELLNASIDTELSYTNILDIGSLTGRAA